MFLKVQYDTTNEWILYHILQAINRRVARQSELDPFTREYVVVSK